MWLRMRPLMMRSIINKLYKSFKLDTHDEDDVESECMHLFFRTYYDKFESENQFMRFIFVSFKNRMIDLKNKERRHAKIFVDAESTKGLWMGGISMDPDTSRNFDLNQINLFEDKSDSFISDIETGDLVDLMAGELLEREVEVLRMMIDGYRTCEIAELLGCSTPLVGHIKKNKIWPLAKKYLDISDDDFEYLSSSGRIYISA